MAHDHKAILYFQDAWKTKHRFPATCPAPNHVGHAGLLNELNEWWLHLRPPLHLREIVNRNTGRKWNVRFHVWSFSSHTLVEQRCTYLMCFHRAGNLYDHEFNRQMQTSDVFAPRWGTYSVWSRDDPQPISGKPVVWDLPRVLTLNFVNIRYTKRLISYHIKHIYWG